jgi:hypothetical protein
MGVTMKSCFCLLITLTGLGLAQAEERERGTSVSLGATSLLSARGVKQAGAGVNGDWLQVWENASLRAELFQPFHGTDPVVGGMRAAGLLMHDRRRQMELFVAPQWFEQVQPGGTRCTVETGLAARWNMSGGWTMELIASHEFRRQAQDLRFMLHYSIPLKNLGAYLEWSGGFGAAAARNLRPDADGPRVSDSYLYYQTSLRLPYRIGATTMIEAGWHLAGTDSQSPFWSPVSASGGFRTWGELSVRFEF